MPGIDALIINFPFLIQQGPAQDPVLVLKSTLERYRVKPVIRIGCKITEIKGIG